MGRATTLLVASAGGHLTQLRMLATRLQPDLGPSTWVSYDDVQSKSALADAHLVYGHGPSTRNLPNAARNWRGANRILAGGHIERVVSTGAGIAVPYLIRATQLGIESHYIESASRVSGPSLTGKLLQSLAPSTFLYTQYRSWAGSRWRFGGSVYDGFSASRRDVRRTDGLRILVSLGTHPDYRFDRLVTSVREVLEPGDSVVWQLGATSPSCSLPGRVETQLASREMESLIRSVDVVIAHAGTGVVLSCLQAGKFPVIVPRSARFGEHIDDHQHVTADEVSRMGFGPDTRMWGVGPGGVGARRVDGLSPH